MKTRYVLKLVKNENTTPPPFGVQRPKLGSYAFLYTPSAEDCTGWFASTRFGHAVDLFAATFFESKAKAETAAKEHGPCGATYQLIEAKVTGAGLKRFTPNPII